MTDYCATDLARHALTFGETMGTPLQELLDEYWMADDSEVPVARLVVDTCAVGYGGHYGEVLEDHREGEALDALATHLAPLYRMTHDEALAMLYEVRDHYLHLVREAAAAEFGNWARRGFLVDRASGPDNCPLCGRGIGDHDELGCEAPDGQRWCIDHALETLATLRHQEETT